MNSQLKKVIIFGVVMTVVAGAGWLGRKSYKRAVERRLIWQAEACLEKRDYRNAAIWLNRALQKNPFSGPGTRLMADTMEKVDAATALGWRIRMDQLEPGNVTNRLQWAQTALRANNKASAAQALAGIKEDQRQSAWFHKLAGALAWSLGSAAETEKHYQEALRLEPGNLANVLNLDTVRLASTNTEVQAAARASLEALATNAVVRMSALHQLAADAIARTNFARAVRFSTEIVAAPEASFADKLDHLQLLKRANDSQFTPFLGAMKLEATNSPALAFGLARWMLSDDGPAVTLGWLQSLPQDYVTNQPLPLLVADCHIASTNWQALMGLVQKQDWQEANFYNFALETLALRQLDQPVPASGAWRKAFQLASHRSDALARLAQFSAAWGWQPENKEVLEEIIAKFPKEKWAGDQLMTRLYQEGNTAALSTLVAKLSEADPNDLRLKNNLANLYLLRKTESDKAHRLAHEVYLSATNDPFTASTYAYSLLLQSKQDEALKVLRNIDVRSLGIPSVAAYYGVVQAQTGHKEAARDALDRAAAANLLPEEKELIRVAKAGL